MTYLIILAVSLLSSAVGAVCGIGGGVIIKPVLDSLEIMPVATVSFLSGMTVLCMSAFLTASTFRSGHSAIRVHTAVPMSLGAAAGGLMGRLAFEAVRAASDSPARVGAVQAACLFALVLGTIGYTLFKSRITTHAIRNPTACAGAGLFLGFFSAFLGIGGGPFNLAVLSFLFSMDAKDAAQNSLFIIMCSQVAGILQTVLTGSVPEFAWPVFWLMASMGILGGIVGKKLNRRLDVAAVESLFVGMSMAILCVCAYNFFNLLG